MLVDVGRRNIFRFLIRLRCQEDLAGIRNAVQALHLNRYGRAGRADGLAVLIGHAADFTGRGTAGDVIADVKRTLLYKEVGYRALALVQLCLEHKTSRQTVRICLQLEDISRQQDGIQQVVDTLTGLGGNLDHLCLAAPVRGNEAVLCQLLLYSVRICAGFIDLVDSNYDLDIGCLRMVDRLDGLRHNAIIRCYNEYGDIRGIRTTHTHGRESFMTGRIEECDTAAIDRNAVGTDVLCDTAGLALCHMGMTDLVEERSFTMIDMAHDADYRRTRNHLALILFILLEHLGDHIDSLFMLAADVIVHGDFFRLVVAHFLVDGVHLTLHEQVFDNNGRIDLHLLSQLTDRQLIADFNLGNLLFLLLILLMGGFLESLRDQLSVIMSTAPSTVVGELVSSQILFILILVTAA